MHPAGCARPARPSTPRLTEARVGDRVGVGAKSQSCLKPDCEQCRNGAENYCPHGVDTYNAVFANGSKSMGGYSDYARVPSHFVLKIPAALSSADAAPMLCGGITVYAPLKRAGAGPGKSVGIVGIGAFHWRFCLPSAQGAGCVPLLLLYTAMGWLALIKG